jgi:ubiquinone/menaquinone biosynthesis C-methylase UbiE
MKNASEVESLFSQKASTWNEKYSVNGPLRYRLDAFKKQLGELVMPPAKILDFGCGTGNLACHLSAGGFAVSACDISAKMIERASENNPGAPVDWFVLSADWRELPFASNTFDAIVASSAFEYLADVNTTFAECRRILKPGGFLIATVPNPRKPIRRVENLLRPMAIMAGKMPILKRIPKLDSYTIYLKCSRNRMSLDEWFAIGNQMRFTAVEQGKSRASNTALVFLVFRKTDNKSEQRLKNQQT